MISKWIRTSNGWCVGRLEHRANFLTSTFYNCSPDGTEDLVQRFLLPRTEGGDAAWKA